jgi:hypothetical protein
LDEPTKQIHVRLPESTRRELRDLASTNKRSMTREIEVAVERHVRNAREKCGADSMWRSGV